MTSTFSQQRLTYLGSLSAELSERGLASRMVGGDDPVLWVWHPDSLRQTIVFATPAKGGWFFLWSPDGQEKVGDFRRVADSLEHMLRDSGQPPAPPRGAPADSG
ncbi:hypothetical protein AB0395_16095 [Streptosporangium sp. NPDC051023]|uniref:hypothetical protein n=1 Tax=Streptosporangium sp. NPDC051023 TaxID=3155410 RepID=UPI00344B5C76